MNLTAPSPPEIAVDPPLSTVVFKTSQGMEIRAKVLRVTPQFATFETYDPTLVLRISEALQNFEIVLHNCVMYSGRAVVRTLVNVGPTMISEVALFENSWTDAPFALEPIGKEKFNDAFSGFLKSWQQFYRVSNDYKVIVADIQTFLIELRLWLEQTELGVRSAPEPQRLSLENEIAQSLRASVTSALSALFERFESIADKIEDDLQPVHHAFGQRQLHPHLLCAPFIHRTYTKPLGYAGDYEMMNMIMRNGFEGNSLYAKLVNAYLLDQAGPQAVRNRVSLLSGKIVEETSRVVRLGRTANVYSLACGPAWEVVNFLSEHPLADHAQFQLLDFDEETLRYTGKKLREAQNGRPSRKPATLVKNSVQNLLRSNRNTGAGARYDLIYCSGLYDYLSDRVVKALNTYLYDQLQPGGLLVVGNFAPNTPVRHFIEHFLEWFLIYRDGKQLAALAPEQASSEDCHVVAESTGANIFLEVRKPR